MVLDEFQLLAARSPELETTISRWWRTTGRDLPIVLVLAGSELSFFEDKVLAGSLYGRRTGQLKLEPFTARDAALFHPGYSDEDKVRAYSVCGGIPYYLERFPDTCTLADCLLTEVFERTGLLHDEAELMLRQSIPDPANHIAVLRSIAHGHNRNSQIADRTGLTSAHVTKILTSLERLGLAVTLRPVSASPRTKKTAYEIEPFADQRHAVRRGPAPCPDHGAAGLAQLAARADGALDVPEGDVAEHPADEHEISRCHVAVVVSERGIAGHDLDALQPGGPGSRPRGVRVPAGRVPPGVPGRRLAGDARRAPPAGRGPARRTG